MVRTTLGDDDILDGDRHARQRPGVFARGELLIHAFGGCQRALRRKVQVGVGLGILGLRELQRRLRQFHRAELALRETFVNLLEW